jgi:transcription antitermination protein NusB
MINRRHIRVKVMQSMYAMQQSKNDDVVKEGKFLKHSILKMFDLYVLNLLMIIEVQKLTEKKIAISKKKMLATKEDLTPNTKILNNVLIDAIKNSVGLESYYEINKLNNWEVDSEYVKIIYEELLKSKIYRNYLDTFENSFNVDRSFVIDFFREIIAPNEKLAEYYEDKMITWVDDIPFVNTWVMKTLSKSKNNATFILESLYKNKDDEDFVLELFNKTFLKQHIYEKEIASKTPNWETDRIADIDMILIKMAITEFLNFPSIPVKVSINEYIEIAKDYSTQKSSFFINGVLDKISKEFERDKRIEKIGRGLL